ncbi:hypothetical protein D4S03_01230 [bacterium]|nr:MAG: hypothetical protein D4S03_01230 [bacterium]
MNKKEIVVGALSVAMFTMSVTVAMAYGEPGPTASGGTPKTAPVCTSEKPQKAWLYRVKSLGKGQYQLYWDKADKASSWSVGYGTQPGKYIYGITSFGNGSSRDLVVNTFSNKIFYFSVKANNGCMPGDWSNEWKVGTAGTLNALLNTGTVKPVIPVIKKTTVVTPTVTKAPTKAITPVVTKTPTVTPVTTLPKTGGFWGWLKGLFQ